MKRCGGGYFLMSKSQGSRLKHAVRELDGTGGGTAHDDLDIKKARLYDR